MMTQLPLTLAPKLLAGKKQQKKSRCRKLLSRTLIDLILQAKITKNRGPRTSGQKHPRAHSKER